MQSSEIALSGCEKILRDTCSSEFMSLVLVYLPSLEDGQGAAIVSNVQNMAMGGASCPGLGYKMTALFILLLTASCSWKPAAMM